MVRPVLAAGSRPLLSSPFSRALECTSVDVSNWLFQRQVMPQTQFGGNSFPWAEMRTWKGGGGSLLWVLSVVEEGAWLEIGEESR